MDPDAEPEMTVGSGSLRLLFCSSLAYPPQAYGGSQSSVQHICAELRRRGYSINLLCPLEAKGLFGLERRLRRNLLNSNYVVDRHCGFATFRCWDILEHAEEVVERVRPDIVIAEAGATMEIARRFVDLGLPTLASIRDVEFENMGGDFFTHERLEYLSNSRFTQERLKETFGIESTVIHPIVDSSQYRTATRGAYVLHINPVQKKGIGTTLKLAEMRPDVTILLCESWPMSAQARSELKSKLANLPNVELRKPARDMRKIYSGARCLLVPSVWDEAWGRVVTEAHISGIPVIARAVGGLPETVGPGGILVEPSAPIDAWSKALTQLWDDAEQHKATSLAALEYSQRETIRPDHLIDRFVHLIEGHIETSRRY